METLTWILAALAVVQLLLLVALWRRPPASARSPELESRFLQLAADLDRVERSVREEHRAGRGESQACVAGRFHR